MKLFRLENARLQNQWDYNRKSQHCSISLQMIGINSLCLASRTRCSELTIALNNFIFDCRGLSSLRLESAHLSVTNELLNSYNYSITSNWCVLKDLTQTDTNENDPPIVYRKTPIKPFLQIYTHFTSSPVWWRSWLKKNSIRRRGIPYKANNKPGEIM